MIEQILLIIIIAVPILLVALFVTSVKDTKKEIKSKSKMSF